MEVLSTVEDPRLAGHYWNSDNVMHASGGWRGLRGRVTAPVVHIWPGGCEAVIVRPSEFEVPVGYENMSWMFSRDTVFSPCRGWGIFFFVVFCCIVLSLSFFLSFSVLSFCLFSLRLLLAMKILVGCCVLLQTA